MTRRGFLIAWLFAAGVAAFPAKAADTKGMCLVCQVLHGETEPEPFKAMRTYQGREYGFCSEKCAKAFDADPAGFVPPELPRPAPAFDLKDLTGRGLSNESLAGRVVLLDFWATWCAPCRKSMPELEALHREYAARGLSVVGVSIDEGDPAKVTPKIASFVKGRKLTYPIALDSDSRPAWESFHVKAVPAAFLIDRQGRIVAQWTGATADMKALRARLETLLADPSSAR
jgi:thiol-disulfide isomerase/thioredoxin